MRLDSTKITLTVKMGKWEHVGVKELLNKDNVWTPCHSFIFSTELNLSSLNEQQNWNVPPVRIRHYSYHVLPPTSRSLIKKKNSPIKDFLFVCEQNF